jgi:hypothetical protein
MSRIISQRPPSAHVPYETYTPTRSPKLRQTKQPGQRMPLSQHANCLCHLQPYSCRIQDSEFKEHDFGLDAGLKGLPCSGGLISIHEPHTLVRMYEKAFQNLQQTNCRVLAKAYIKVVEPRKQVNYPYNGRKAIGGRTVQLDPEQTKPPWWPPQVRHREPDHLPKVGTFLG